jgi:predicted amidophosphoribosyltransferase
MVISVLSRAQYLTAVVEQMRQADYNATHLVKAVKGRPLGSAYATVKIGEKWVAVAEANKDRAMDWFAEWAAGHVNSLGTGPKIIVPIPSSKTIVTSADDFRTAIIAAKVAGLCPNTVACPNLRFDQVMASSSEEGGTRDAYELYERLRLIGDLPAGQVVLLDDVLTGGGHMKASAWTIRDVGREVQHALCCGRTIDTQLPDPFTVEPEIIEA